jgi:hypothetical protein
MRITLHYTDYRYHIQSGDDNRGEYGNNIKPVYGDNANMDGSSCQYR